MLHHVGLSWIIEANQQLKLHIREHNTYWITDGPWYNTSICTKLYETVFENLLEIQELIDIILYALF